MKIAVAGFEYDAPVQVVLFDFDHGAPIFHRPADDFESVRDGDDVVFWRVKTRCGQTTYCEDDRGERTLTETRGSWIPTKHAIKFGRPCSTCWPELRRHPTLFSKPAGAAQVEQLGLR